MIMMSLAPFHLIIILHCVKRVRIWSYSGAYFPAFGLNTERYSVSLHSQSECGKIRSRISPNMDTFQAVLPALSYSPTRFLRQSKFWYWSYTNPEPYSDFCQTWTFY